MPTVSVIIPTFNHRAFIERTLHSVFDQTLAADAEVIVINDGSTDGTPHLLRPLVDSGRIIYIEQPNAGQAAARNAGVARAKGRYIAFLDDDDTWLPDKLAWQVDFLDHCSDCVVVGGAVAAIDEADRSIADWTRPARQFSVEEVFDECPFVSPGQALIRRDTFLTVGGLNPELWGTDDYDLWFRLARLGRIARTEQPCLRYRVHADNASRNSLRMALNVLRVVSTNARLLPPAHRRRAKWNAMRWMYGRWGKPGLKMAASQLLRGDVRQTRSLAQLWPFVAHRITIAAVRLLGGERTST